MKRDGKLYTHKRLIALICGLVPLGLFGYHRFMTDASGEWILTWIFSALPFFFISFCLMAWHITISLWKKEKFDYVLIALLIGPTLGLVFFFLGAATLIVDIMTNGLKSSPQGRPIREGDGFLLATTSESDGWVQAKKLPSVEEKDGELRQALAKHWKEAALTEHSSIANFSRLTQTLMGAGAPANLVQDCLRAAKDEVHHAKRCFALSSAYIGSLVSADVFPELLSMDKPLLELGTDVDELLVKEALEEGAFFEGFAAKVARKQIEVSKDPIVTKTLEFIARDEARHATLGWETIEWCLKRTDGDIIPFLLEEVSKLPKNPPIIEASKDFCEEELNRNGLLSQKQSDKIFQETRESVATRVLEMVANAQQKAA